MKASLEDAPAQLIAQRVKTVPAAPTVEAEVPAGYALQLNRKPRYTPSPAKKLQPTSIGHLHLVTIKSNPSVLKRAI